MLQMKLKHTHQTNWTKFQKEMQTDTSGAHPRACNSLFLPQTMLNIELLHPDDIKFCGML